ncbi:MAG: peroxiredoxin [Firmicutes bacterium]|nr:peroxiredoxin [Bacillota bacterium]
MLTIGDRFPAFSLTALIPGDLGTLNKNSPDDYFMTVDAGTYADKWRVFFFWPKDFTFVCPTEIAEFGKKYRAFVDRDAEILGGSVDNEYAHYAWRRQHPDLKAIPYPMMADIRRELTGALGILNEEGVAGRATFLVDPNGVIQFVMVTPGSVGRNVDEVLRVLDALQTDELCPCNWKQGEPTIDARAALTGVR